jgi:hypothetical protein
MFFDAQGRLRSMLASWTSVWFYQLRSPSSLSDLTVDPGDML